MATREMRQAVRTRYEKMVKESAVTEINKKRTESYVDWLESYVANDLFRHCRFCKRYDNCEPAFTDSRCNNWSFGGDK